MGPTSNVSSRRELRPQGQRTRARLLAAGLQILAERGYAASRVDDVVRIAETSRGTFYLYFKDKEDLFRALAHAAADDMAALADDLGPIDEGPAGRDELRRFLDAFYETYERHGAVIRAWAENQVDDPALVDLGLDTFSGLAAALVDRLSESGTGPVADVDLAATIFLATLERLVYFATSRPLGLPAGELLDELAGVLHRGFFGGRVDGLHGVSPRRGARSRRC
ncbi:MAG: TetR/AcrR family transcriptional regulator [Acidimicrobiales bacterium]